MTVPTTDVVICGAGIAGISIAYQHAVTHQMRNIILVDPLSPMTMTSDKSTECYRSRSWMAAITRVRRKIAL